MVLERWFSDFTPATYSGFGVYFEDDPFELKLEDVLAIEMDEIGEFGTTLLRNQDIPPELSNLISTLSWQLRAYHQFIDIQEVSVDGVSPMLNRHFCFFESIVYIREAILSWIHRNTLSSLTLLRPFLELSILHLYWFFKGNDSDFSAYYNWLESGRGKPPFKNQFDYLFDHHPYGEFVPHGWRRELRERLWESYRILCSYNHTPFLEESITARSQNFESPAFSAFFEAGQLIAGIIQDLVRLHAFSFPLMLYPIDVYRKWAFSGPLGVFVHPMNTKIVRKALGEEEFRMLSSELMGAPGVEDKFDWAKSQADLTDDQILADWREQFPQEQAKDPISSVKKAIAKERAFRRALSWQMNYVVGRLEGPMAS